MAAFTVAFLDYGITIGMGALYVGMLDTYSAGRAKTALVQSLIIAISTGFGVIGGYLIARFGVRIVTFCAAFMTALGFTLSFFSTTIYELYGYISVIAGIGFATMYISAVVSVGRVFSGKHTSIALSLQSLGTGLAGFMWPNVLNALCDMYSVRGTFLILGGMYLNNFAFAIIFANCDNDKRNVKTKNTEKHSKACVVTECPTEVTEIDNDLDLDLDVYKSAELQEVVNEYSEQNFDDKCEIGRQKKEDKAMDIFNTNVKTNVHHHFTSRNNKKDISENDKNKKQVDESRKHTKCSLKYFNERDPRNSSEELQKTEKEFIRIAKTEVRNSNQEKSSWKVLVSMLFVACIFHSSSLFGFITVYQDINVFNGLTIAQSDFTFMGYALLNVLSRFLPIIPARVDCISSFTVPAFSSLCGAVGQIIFLTTSSLTGAFVAMAFTGVSDGGLIASVQAIVFEILPEEKQAVGFGVSLTAIGFASGVTGPIFGSLRDDTFSYQIVLIVTTSLFLMSASLEFVFLVMSLTTILLPFRSAANVNRAFVGHKWIVFMAAFTVAFLNYGLIVTMGALYVGMLDTYNAGRAKTALVQSLAITFSWGFGVISGQLLTRFGVRIVTFCAALMTALGFTLSFFSTTIYELYGYISVIAGMGFATIYVSAVVSVGRVFSGRQQSIALSLQSGGTALSGFMWPNVLHALFDVYGLRGTFLLLGGMFLNNVAFAIIFSNCENEKRIVETKTAEEHSETYNEADCPTEVTEIDNELNLDLNVYKKSDMHEVVNEQPGQISHTKKKVRRRNNKVTVLKMNDQIYRKTDHEQYNSTENIDSEDVRINEENQVDDIRGDKEIKTRKDITESLKSYNESAGRTISELSEEMGQRINTITTSDGRNSKHEIRFWKTLFSIFVVAGILNMSTLSGFVTVYQDINVFNGLTIAQSDLTFMSYALLNVLSRFLPIIPARVDCISSFAVPAFSSLCGAVGQIIFLTTSSLTGAIVAMAFTGVSDGGLIASMQAIVFELLPVEKQAIGFGFVLTTFGIVSGATGPIFGSLRDDTSSYQTVLIITTSLFLISALLELICIVISKIQSNLCNS